MSKFIPFHTMTAQQADEIVEKSLRDHPRIHVEPVVFGSEGDADARLCALHLQVGDEHAVLTIDRAMEFLSAFQSAALALTPKKNRE